MGQLVIYKDTYSDSTVIPNRFIDEYMKDANDAQLKIYLYLIRMLNSNQGTSISDIADKFNHTEKDVVRSLKYWEENQLLALDYDNSKNLIGIHLQDFHSSTESSQTLSIPVSPTEPVKKEVLDVSPSPAPLEKPSYSLEQLKAFRAAESTSQLLFIVESYIGKPLSSSEIQTILFIYDCLKFSVDLIDYLVQYCVDNNKKSFHYIEKIAINWADENISTVKQAASYQKKYTKTTYAIMKALGKSSDPTPKEKEYMTLWTNQMGFSLDVILEACNRTTMQTDRGRFPYANQILTSWKAANVHHLSDITEIDSTFKKSKPALPKTSSNNKFNDFMQSSYNISELEKELLHN